MARPWIYRILEQPVVYNVAQAVLAPGAERALARLYDESFGSTRGRVLNVGSGPRPETPFPEGNLVALDINDAYVARFVASDAPDSCRVSGVVASADALPFKDAAFDECRSVFVLHHLPEAQVRTAIGEMQRIVRPGGRVVLFDMVKPDAFLPNPVPWLIARYDRGEWVRTAGDLERLAHEAAGSAWETRVFRYSWIGLRGMILVLKRE